MSERTNPHPARVGRAGGKSIRRARRCARKKVVAIALEVVPLEPKVVAHAKDLVPLVRDEVANAPEKWLLAGRTSRSRARWSRSTKRKDQSRFWRTRCGRRLSRFRQMVTRTRPRTARSGRVSARFDPRWANFVGGDRSRTAGARATVAGRRDRIEGGRDRIDWVCYRTKWGRYRMNCGRDCIECGRYCSYGRPTARPPDVHWRGHHLGSGLTHINPATGPAGKKRLTTEAQRTQRAPLGFRTHEIALATIGNLLFFKTTNVSSRHRDVVSSMARGALCVLCASVVKASAGTKRQACSRTERVISSPSLRSG